MLIYAIDELTVVRARVQCLAVLGSYCLTEPGSSPSVAMVKTSWFAATIP